MSNVYKTTQFVRPSRKHIQDIIIDELLNSLCKGQNIRMKSIITNISLVRKVT